MVPLALVPMAVQRTARAFFPAYKRVGDEGQERPTCVSAK